MEKWKKITPDAVSVQKYNRLLLIRMPISIITIHSQLLCHCQFLLMPKTHYF